MTRAPGRTSSPRSPGPLSAERRSTGSSEVAERMATFTLIPGAGTDSRVFEATIEALGDVGHDGIAPPLPLDDRDATPSDHADAVAASAAGRDELVVVAQSLGAFAGPLVAVRVPVAQLIL